MARLTLSLLGSFEVTLDGVPVTAFDTAKVRALLAYLAVEADHAHSRDALAGLLWPDYPDRSARTNLRNALASLRAVIGDRNRAGTHDRPFLLVNRQATAGGPTIQFNLASDCQIDVQVFWTLVEGESPDAGQLEQAVVLYRGPFLDGFSVGDSASFENWVLHRREQFERQALGALDRLAAQCEAQGELERACAWARRQLELASWQEEAHRRLMRLLALSGQRSAALAQYEACRRALKEELDVEPGIETTRLYEQIRDGELRQEARHEAPGATAPAIPASPRVAAAEHAPATQPKGTPPSPQQGPAAADRHEGQPASKREAELQGERRLATVLFADVKGSTALAEQVGVEDWVEMMNQVLQILSAEVYRYGGEVNQYRGDGLVAFFGVPTAHEDDPERAVLAGLAMQEAIQRGAADFADRWGVELYVRVGVDTGEVIAASIGDSHRHREETAMGQAIALADRMQKAAEPGTVLVTGNTYRLVEPLFEWRARGEIDVKGVSQPVAVYCPLSPRLGSGKGRGIAGLGSPLVGREGESQALQESIRRLQSGVGGIVTLTGEAGIGKSRLVAEVRKQTLAKVGQDLPQPSQGGDVQWIEGRCLSYGASTAYQLWLDMMRGVLGVAPDAGPQALREALRERVSALCPDRSADVYPYLGHVMSLPLEEEAQAALSALESENLKVHIFRAVATLIESSARRRPLVIVCEDLHWADPTSIELLEHLLPLADRAALLFICVFRPETEHGCWRIKETAARDYRHCHTELGLAPLSADESEMLVHNLLRGEDARPAAEQGGRGEPGEDLPQALRERMLRYAEGNPFYVEEIIRALVDDQIIVRDPASGRWQTTRPAAEVPIPETLHAVLASRIDRLPAEARRVLQRASVIGRVFAYRVLAAIAGDIPALDAQLIVLQRAQMVRERARLPEREFIFKHHLTQETAYGMLLSRERRACHRQVAETLERLHPERSDEYVELLAHHWEQAQEAGKAVVYLIRAGEKAARQYANREALGYLGQALARIEPGEEYDRLLSRRAGVNIDLFRGQEAAHDYERLLASAQQHGDRAAEFEAFLGLAQAHYILALDAQAPDAASQSLELYRLAQQLAHELGDRHLQVRAVIPTVWFADFWPEYQDELFPRVREMLRLSQEIGDDDLIIDSMLALWRTDLPGWAEHGEKLIPWLESRRDMARLNQTYFHLMWTHLNLGNLERCVACCDAGIRLAAEIGVPPVQYPTIKAMALMRLGRYGAAWRSLQAEVADEAHPFGRAFRDMGTGFYLADLLAYGEAIPLLKGVGERARGLRRTWMREWCDLQVACALARSAPQERAELETRAQRFADTSFSWAATFSGLPGQAAAEISLALGRIDQAREQIEQACIHTQARGSRPDHASALEVQARILLALGHAQEALAAVDAGLATAVEMGYRPIIWRLYAAQASALEMLGDDRGAAQAYASAAAIVLELAETIPDRALATRFLTHSSVAAILAAAHGRFG